MKSSFSIRVREELCGLKIKSRHCALAELAAFIKTACESGPDEIIMHTEHPFISKRFNDLVNYVFTAGTPVHTILSAAGSLGERLDPVVVMSECCQRAYIRGCLITAGTVSDPRKNYHLELTFLSSGGEALAGQLKDMLISFGINAKTRKDHPLVYVKEAENIVEILRLTGAGKSLLQFESTRITKEIANDVNRKVNFETANLSKTISAAVGQLNDIKYIAERKGLGYLSKPLEDVARLRLEYETASLQEIGAMLDRPVSKSGVNHRLRKISEIAETLRDEGEY